MCFGVYTVKQLITPSPRFFDPLKRPFDWPTFEIIGQGVRPRGVPIRTYSLANSFANSWIKDTEVEIVNAHWRLCRTSDFQKSENIDQRGLRWGWGGEGYTFLVFRTIPYLLYDAYVVWGFGEGATMQPDDVVQRRRRSIRNREIDIVWGRKCIRNGNLKCWESHEINFEGVGVS